MSLVFLGSTDTGWYCLEQLVNHGFEIKGIITGQQQFEISYARETVHNYRHRSFLNFEQEHDIPVVQFQRKFDPDITEAIVDWKPRLLIVAGWYHLIPQAVRNLAPLGAVGIHWSLLPRYRGGSPLVWAMIRGEKETGATLFYLVNQVDAGDILAQASVKIEDHEDVADMIGKLNKVSALLLQEQLPKILSGTAVATPQDESRATYFPPRQPHDGQVDWNWGAQRIYDFIRAQTLPYPCAFSSYQGETIRLVSSTLDPRKGQHVFVKAGDGKWLGLDKIMIAGNEVLQAQDYFDEGAIQFDG